MDVLPWLFELILRITKSPTIIHLYLIEKGIVLSPFPSKSLSENKKKALIALTQVINCSILYLRTISLSSLGSYSPVSGHIVDMPDPSTDSLVPLLHRLYTNIYRQIVFSNNAYSSIANTHDRVQILTVRSVQIRAQPTRLPSGNAKVLHT